jgi:exodeoxyribonuclease X
VLDSGAACVVESTQALAGFVHFRNTCRVADARPVLGDLLLPGRVARPLCIEGGLYMRDVSTGQVVIRILDLETTGLDPATGGVCELAAIDLVYSRDTESNSWSNDLKAARSFETLVNPGCPIPPEASGIHHLTDKDVAHSPPFLEALQLMKETLGPCQFYAAHNAPFDSKWIAHATGQPASEVPWLCTLKISRELFGELANHQLGTMRYALREPYFDDADVIGNPHEAIADVRVAFQILQRVLRQHEPEALLQMSNDPVLRHPAFRIWFGKHRGLRFSDQIPDDYLRWMVGQPNMEPDKRLTAEHWLAWRRDNGIVVPEWHRGSRMKSEASVVRYLLPKAEVSQMLAADYKPKNAADAIAYREFCHEHLEPWDWPRSWPHLDGEP